MPSLRLTRSSCGICENRTLLATLPRPERAGGLVEGLKHGAILDEAHFEEIAHGSDRLLEAEPDAAHDCIVASVRLKARIVAEDEREAGYRQVLNFGHTVGHALEAATGYRISHGVGVALGMLAEAHAGEKVGITQPGTAPRLHSAVQPLLRAAETDVGGVDLERVFGFLGVDKKARGGNPRYVLLERIGSVASEGGWSRELPAEIVLEALARALAAVRR